MSRIDKMHIQGIRSFGPDEPRKISFGTPLTLILGQNGCGKTTIIESLKYISTGDVPPGCGKGAAFVHDPKMAREPSVRGQIKLLFQGIQNQTCIVTRSVEVTQKRKKPEFKTIDSTIKIKRDDQPAVEISGKCADIDAEMISRLGVSKPILTNVIFCHQEDSNWPLEEDKKVKDKFDAIFNATKYIKCLETIRKLRMEMKAKVKSMHDVLDGLRQWKEEANRKRDELKSLQEQHTSITEKKQKIKEEMEPIVDRMRAITEVEENIGIIRGDLGGKQHKLASLRQMQDELRATLTEQLDCSDEELHHMILDFRRNLDEKEAEQKRTEKQMSDVERSMSQNQLNLSKAVKKQGELEANHNRHKDYVERRNNQLTDTAEKYTFNEFMGRSDFNEAQAKSILDLLVKEIEQERKAILAKKQEFEGKEAEIQSTIDDLRSREAALDHDIKSKGKALEDTTRKIRQVKQQLKNNENDLSAVSLDSIHSELSEVENLISAEEEKLNPQQVAGEIESEKRTRRDIERKLDDIKRIVSKMNRQAEARSQYDIHMKDKKDLENRVEFLKRKHADELEHLLGEIPQENIKNKMDACTASIRQRISDLRQEVEQLNRKKTQLDTSIKGHKQQLARKEQDVKDLESKIDGICQGTDLDKALEKSKKLKEDLTRERGDLSSSITVFNRFVDKLKQRDCCPLCHRDFGTEDEVSQLIEELESKVSSVPGRLKQVKGKLDQQEKVHDQMIQLQPQRQQAIQLRTEVENIRNQVDSEVKALEKVGMDLESKMELFEITQEEEETARVIQSDVIIMENNLKKIKQLKDQIDDIQTTLGSSDGGMSMEEAIAQQSELEEQLRKSQMKVEELQERLQSHKDRLQGFRDRKLKLSTKELELKTKLQESEKLKEEIQKFEEDRSRIEEEREKAQAEVAPFKYQITSKTKEKTNLVREKDSWIETQTKKVNKISEEHRSVNELHQSIVAYIAKGEEEHLKESRERVTQLQEDITASEQRKKSLEDKIRSIQKELSMQRERKRSLDDEKKIREKEVEAKQIQRDIARLQDKIQGYDYDKLMEEKGTLQDRAARLQNQRAAQDGRIQEIQKAISGLETDLRRKEVREAEKNYKEKFVLMKCTDVAADDLNKYYKALDTAIMHFHSDRMRSINGIIRELWRSTYKGNDIDYIEIKTDENESAGISQRRTYNYRVVMVKNDTEMDMRGRCSAGQKVLASIIIRMALGETFSTNCGILALDEPTTNLDRENIEALSMALVDIVNKRSHQRNFQLIVITHDHDFLEKMTRADFIDHYFEISRDERGLSVIKQQEVTSL